jgi:hypothetical protein
VTGGLLVLMTNCGLDHRAGSELYVRDVATALLDRGHTPVVYSPVLGKMASELRTATIPVTDNLDSLATTPDVIHGQHHVETMTALLRFPDTPAVAICHGWLPWVETPVRFPRIRRYVAVDHTCRDRLLFEHAIPEDRVSVLLNFADLDRFRPRGPLPPRPERALVFSNYAGPDTYARVVREACERSGIALDIIGRASGVVSDEPEAMLRQYDLVFAKGRAAIESLVVGAAVVLCDEAGLGPMVTTADLDRLRPLNFGVRTIREAVTPDAVAREIARYDPADAGAVSARMRAEAGRDAVVDQLVELYRSAIAEQASQGRDVEAEGRAAAAYLRWLTSKPANGPAFDELSVLRRVLPAWLKRPLGRTYRALSRARR